MIFGALLLMAIFSVFTVTHFLEFSSDQPPLELAAELSIILISGLFIIVVLILVRHLL